MNTTTVTVNVQVQMDVNKNNPLLEQVQNVLEVMNNIVSMSEIEAQPQIFISDINDSDIITNEDENEN